MMTECIHKIIKIMLVDDHPMLRKGIAQLIELEDDLEVIAEVNNAELAIHQCISEAPDLVILDLNMKGLNGIECLKALKKAGIDSKVVIFTVSDLEADLVQALRVGADGYILKDCEPDWFINSIHRIMEGELVVSPELTQVLARAFAPKNDESSIIDKLTLRERNILQNISEGDTNKEIARKLDITEGTVKVHVKNLLKKMQLRTRVEAAIYVVENKLF